MAWRPEQDDTFPANTSGSSRRDADRDSGWGAADTPSQGGASGSRRMRSSRTLADIATVHTPAQPPRPTLPNPNTRSNPGSSGPQSGPPDPRWDWDGQYGADDAPFTYPTARQLAPSRSLPGMTGSSNSGSFGPPSRALTPRRPETGWDVEDRSLLVRPPATQGTALPPALLAPKGQKAGKGGWRWTRLTSFAVVVITLVVAVVVMLGVGAHQTQLQVSKNVPDPTGRGPWSAAAGNIVYIPPPPKTAAGAAGSTGAKPTGPGMASPLEPCKDSYKFVPNISQWTVPPGCYANIYIPNPANYVSRPGFGWCNWWVRVTHPNHPDITENTSYPRGYTPVPGAPIFFDGYEQGALSAGHWAVVVAVAPDHYWVLISEMNFDWRGGGFGKIDYRYIHVSPHVHFVYIYS